MDNPSITELERQPEGERLERCAQPDDSSKIKAKFLSCLCAFANDLAESNEAGYFLFGVDDASFDRSGARIDDKTKLRLSDWIDNNITPPISYSFIADSNSSGDVLLVQVAVSQHPPHRYKKRIWVRRGPKTVEATKADEDRLASKAAHHIGKDFVDQPVLQSSIDDLAQDMLAVYWRSCASPETISDDDRTPQQQWAALGLYDLKRDCPNNAGLIAFPHPERIRDFFSNAYVRFVKTRALDLDDVNAVIADKIVQGDFNSMVREIESLINAYNRSNQQTNGWKLDRVDEYIPWTIRELLINAIIHRDYRLPSPIDFYWYRDRIEIKSPGGLVYPASIDTIGQIRAYRNGRLADVMKAWRYIEGYGSGINRVRKILTRHGMPELELSEKSGYFLACVRQHPDFYEPIQTHVTVKVREQLEALDAELKELGRDLERAQRADPSLDQQQIQRLLGEVDYMRTDLREAEEKDLNIRLPRSLQSSWDNLQQAVVGLQQIERVALALDRVRAVMEKLPWQGFSNSPPPPPA